MFRELINRYGGSAPEATLPDGTDIDFFATEADYSTGVSGLVAQYGTNSGEELVVDEVAGNTVIYGLGGNDSIFGRRGSGDDDVLVGGSGTDEIRGRGGTIFFSEEKGMSIDYTVGLVMTT